VALEILTAASAPPLERELLARIAQARAHSPFAPILVIAPTGRILSRVRRLVLEDGAAVWGLHLLHHRALAGRIVESAGGEPLRVLRGRQQRTLLVAALAARRSTRDRSALEQAADGSPGLASAMTATLRDLREACVAPEALEGVAGAAPLAGLYAEWSRRIEALESAGLGDASALARQAEAAVPESGLVGSAAAVFHIGAYDLTGMNRRLLEAVGRRTPVTLLVPGVAGGPAFAHARAALVSWVGADRAAAARAFAPVPEDGPFAPRASALFDDAAAPEPLLAAQSGGPGPIAVHTVAGAESELAAAARRALALITRPQAEGGPVPPHRIAVVARSLEPYAPLLEPVLARDHGLPFTSPARAMLRNDPRARALRDLIEALTEDFPAAALMEFLRSDAANLSSFELPEGPARPNRWAAAARSAGIVVGRAAWTEDLPDWAEARLQTAQEREDATAEDEEDSLARHPSVAAAERTLGTCRALAGVVAALGAEADAWDGLRSWGAHADFLERLAETRLRPADPAAPAAAQALAALLASLREQELLEARGPVDRARAAATVLQAIDTESLALRPASGQGIAILDVMQMRGLSFDAVIFMGLHGGLWPLRRHPDPCLGDEARAALAAATGAPVPLRSDLPGEERLLLALTLGAARRQLALSWQRADEQGRQKAPSIALRELARALAGRPETAALTGIAAPLPLHPVLRAEREAAEGPGVLAPRDAAIAAASRRDPATAIASVLGADRPERPGPQPLAAAAMLAGFSPAPEYDGGVGPGVFAEPVVWSPTRFERFGRCPMQAFFRDRLRIEPPLDGKQEWLLDAGELGEAAHRVLHGALGALTEGGRPAAHDTGAVAKVVQRRFDAETSRQAARIGRRFPALWDSLRTRWSGSLARTVSEELQRLRERKGRILGREQQMEAEIPPGGAGPPIALSGRIDRLDLEAADTLVVVDYKSGGHPEKILNATQALKGNRLQMHLYGRMARAQAAARPPAGGDVVLRIVPVGPSARRTAAGNAKALQWPAEGADPSPELESALDGTIGTLARLAAQGLFPMLEEAEGWPCDICDFRSACRIGHPPAEARVAAAEEFQPFYTLKTLAASKAARKGS